MHNRDKYNILAEKNQMMWYRYRKIHNKVTDELRKSVEAYYKSLVDETSHNPRYIWMTVKKILNKDEAITFPSSVTFNSDHIQTSNDHFVTIGSKLANKTKSKAADDHLQYLHADVSSTVSPFVFIKVDEHLLKRGINKFRCSKSPEHDKIPVKVIKGAVDILAKPLAAMFNSCRSWSFGTLDHDLLMSKLAD